MDRRFLTLDEMAELLNVSRAQAYALVRRGDLPAIKLGGRGQWRIEIWVLDEFVSRMYEETAAYLKAHPNAPLEDDAGAT